MIERLNVLYSYEFLRRSKRFMELALSDARNSIDVMIDSGAFSIRKQKLRGIPPSFTLDQYMRDCIDLFHGKVWNYVALDVIQEPEASDANLTRMAEAGLTPMPVFVIGTAIEKSLELIERAGCEWLCVPGGTASKFNYIAHQFQQVEKHTKGRAKLHGLGYVRWPSMFQLPLASVDASSWRAGARYGAIHEYSRNKGMQIALKIRGNTSAGWESGRGNLRIAKLAERNNIPADALSHKDPMFKRDGPGSLLTANAYLDLMEHAEQLGLKVFLVCASTSAREELLAVFKSRRANGTFDYQEAVRLIGEGVGEFDAG